MQYLAVLTKLQYSNEYTFTRQHALCMHYKLQAAVVVYAHTSQRSNECQRYRQHVTLCSCTQHSDKTLWIA
jgi:hypothetical protein